MQKPLKARIKRLETMTQSCDFGYAICVSDPMTAAELAEIERYRIAGRPHILVPHTCADVDEWHARHPPP